MVTGASIIDTQRINPVDFFMDRTIDYSRITSVVLAVS